MADGEGLRLQFHHNVIEHLGLRLYQNKAEKVICELVSNAWDADALGVWIDITGSNDDREISVLDNGVGMDRTTLQDSFLTIAAPRRGGQNAAATTLGGRPLMGRKGIGKLAPFGICRTVDVITGTVEEGFHWISLDLDEIQKITPDARALEGAQYSPPEFVSGGTLQDVAGVDRLHGARDRFVDLVGKQYGRGTAIILTRINDRVKISPDSFRKAIGRRFTITLARPDFRVSVDGVELAESDVMPPFVFRLPATGMAEDLIGSLRVKYWVGFSEKPFSRSVDSGIGVFAHGKIAQDRPFYFDITGNDLYTPYIYGVVEADWLDDFAEDLISTDRTSLDWEHPQAALLKIWGQKALRRWISEYQTYRKEHEEEEGRDLMAKGIASGELPRLTEAEQKSLVDLLSDLSPRLPPDSSARETVVAALASAWLHKPAREMIKELWERLRTQADGAPDFVATLESLRAYLVPEALSASVTFAQRAFALTVLYELVHLGKEPDLQKLIETFPWLVGPDCEYLTANQTLRSVVAEAEKREMFARQSDSHVRDALKPDFVFLSDIEYRQITVVELKSPLEEVTIENREQLASYLTFLEGKYPDAELRGILVGNAPGGFKTKREDIELRSWQKVFVLARSAYTTIMASMLSGYAENASDPRIGDVHEFGGEQVWELLQGVAQKDPELRALLAQHEKLIGARPTPVRLAGPIVEDF